MPIPDELSAETAAPHKDNPYMHLEAPPYTKPIPETSQQHPYISYEQECPATPWQLSSIFYYSGSLSLEYIPQTLCSSSSLQETTNALQIIDESIFLTSSINIKYKTQKHLHHNMP